MDLAWDCHALLKSLSSLRISSQASLPLEMDSVFVVVETSCSASDAVAGLVGGAGWHWPSSG